MLLFPQVSNRLNNELDPGLPRWAQQLRLWAPRAGLPGSIPGWGTRSHMPHNWRSQLEKNNNVTDPQALSGRSDATNRWMALRIPSGQPTPVQSMMGERGLLLSLLWSISGPHLRMHGWITFPKIITIIHQPLLLHPHYHTCIESESLGIEPLRYTL